MDIDTDQLKAALDSDILILDCRRDGKYTIKLIWETFMVLVEHFRSRLGPWNL